MSQEAGADSPSQKADSSSPQQRPSKRQRTQSLFERIPTDLVPLIVSKIPTPHLQYRLVNKACDREIKAAHSLGHCQECEVQCRSIDQVLTRMQLLKYKEGEKELPWPRCWKITSNFGLRTDYPTDIFDVHNSQPHRNRLKSGLVPYLDSLDSGSCYSITLDVFNIDPPPEVEELAILADWCLEHSKPPKYNFFLSAGWTEISTEEMFSSFFRAPSMKHVTSIRLNHYSLRYPLTSLCDSETVANLRYLSFEECHFSSHEAECLASSAHLTNLTQLIFDDLDGLDGMKGADRKIGFDTIICSPIMKHVKSFTISTFHGLGYNVVEAFAKSKYLGNLSSLELHGILLREKVLDGEEWSLEPLLRCDATMPELSELRFCLYQIAEAAMTVITSPTSALFNRIESLDFTYSTITNASVQALFRTSGLKSLKSLTLRDTKLSNENLELLAAASSSQFCNLQILDVSENPISNKAVLALYSAQNLASLRQINFEGCFRIEAHVLKEICVIPPRPNLRLLSFPNFRLSPESKLEAQAELKMAAPQLEVKEKAR